MYPSATHWIEESSAINEYWRSMESVVRGCGTHDDGDATQRDPLSDAIFVDLAGFALLGQFVELGVDGGDYSVLQRHYF